MDQLPERISEKVRQELSRLSKFGGDYAEDALTNLVLYKNDHCYE